jgi:prevent-host-death family protein
MIEIPTGEARKNLAALVKRVAYDKEQLVLTRHGKQLCALVPIEDLSLLNQLRGAASRNDINDALVEHTRGEAIEWTALKRELGIDE